MERYNCCIRLHGAFSLMLRNGATVILGAKHQALLAMLATSSDGVRTRAYLQANLWGRSAPEQAAASLRTALTFIRKALGTAKPVLGSNRERVWLDLERAQVIFPKPGDTFLEGLDIRAEDGFDDWLRQERTLRQPELEGQATERISVFGFAQPEDDVRDQTILPSIAVLPFFNQATDQQKDILGHLVSEQLARTLSRHENFSVISHLSARSFTSPLVSAEQVNAQLNVHFLMTGTFNVSGRLVRFDVDLHSMRSNRIMWSRQFVAPLKEILAGEDDMVRTIGQVTSRSVLKESATLATTQPLPDLDSHELLMGSISAMQNPDFRQFQLAGRMLETVVERAPDHPVPLAWLAHWHALQVNKGYSLNLQQDFDQAEALSDQALTLDPYSSFALSVRGMVMAFGRRDLPGARKILTEALDINPSQPNAHLHLATLNAFEDAPEASVRHAKMALQLSPLDPQMYLFQSLAATAHLAAGDFHSALEHANASYKMNRRHPSTLRVRTIALQQLGLEDEARKSLAELRRIEPQLTVSNYLARHPSGRSRTGQDWAHALRAAGLPN